MACQKTAAWKDVWFWSAPSAPPLCAMLSALSLCPSSHISCPLLSFFFFFFLHFYCRNTGNYTPEKKKKQWAKLLLAMQMWLQGLAGMVGPPALELTVSDMQLIFRNTHYSYKFSQERHRFYPMTLPERFSLISRTENLWYFERGRNEKTLSVQRGLVSRIDSWKLSSTFTLMLGTSTLKRTGIYKSQVYGKMFQDFSYY